MCFKEQWTSINTMHSSGVIHLCQKKQVKVPIVQLHTTQRRHIASISLFAYNFLMDGPTFGMKIDKQNKIAFTLLQNV